MATKKNITAQTTAKAIGDIFFETASTVDRFGKRGNGIGLATVKKLILRAGGHIQFNTESGKGTTFEFTMSR
jgi:signal transduction histidine kinase